MKMYKKMIILASVGLSLYGIVSGYIFVKYFLTYQ